MHFFFIFVMCRSWFWKEGDSVIFFDTLLDLKNDGHSSTQNKEQGEYNTCRKKLDFEPNLLSL